MADKNYKLKFEMSDGTQQSVQFTAPQGPKGDKGDKGETGAVGPAGPKGDTGDSGVYVGDTAPTDSSVNVWINPKGDDAEIVTTTPQDLTEEQKAQARENIGASTYYHTEREEVGAEHEEINAAYIWGLYDALADEYNTYKSDKNGKPILDENGNKIPLGVRVQKVDYSIGDFKQYAYEISTGEYSTEGGYILRDGSDGIKKPKFLVMSGIDGNERKTVFSTYRFVRDILRGHNVPKSFKEDVILHVLPVGSPWAFSTLDKDNKPHRFNENDVYIENNFDCEWNKNKPNSGTAAASEKETQAITNWLNSNADADLFISFHNSGELNALVAILGDSTNDATDMAKKIALRGVARVIPFWKDVIGYPLVFKDVLYKEKNEEGKLIDKIGDADTIFSYSAGTRIGGSSFLYAQEKLGIPGFVMETPAYYGTYQEWQDNYNVYQPEPISAGAEALGNILIEFYEQLLLSEVNSDMKEVNTKLDALLLSASFRVIKGTFIPTEDMYVLVPDASDSKKDKYHFTIPGVPTDACILEFLPVDEISKVSIGDYSAGQSFPANYGVIPLMPRRLNNVRAGNLDYVIYQNDKETIGAQPTSQFKVEIVDGGVKWIIGVSDGTKFEVGKKYEWTAYYWSE